MTEEGWPMGGIELEFTNSRNSFNSWKLLRCAAQRRISYNLYIETEICVIGIRIHSFTSSLYQQHSCLLST